jgi:hypothetical protein
MIADGLGITLVPLSPSLEKQIGNQAIALCGRAAVSTGLSRASALWDFDCNAKPARDVLFMFLLS